MKYFKCTVFVILLLLFKQGFSQVTITAKMKGLKAGTPVYYGLEQTFNKEKDSLLAKEGGFSLTLPVNKENTDFYRFQIGKDGTGSNTDIIYLSAGKLTISAPGPNFENVVYSGSDFAEQQNEMRKIMQPIKDWIKNLPKDKRGIGGIMLVSSYWLDWVLPLIDIEGKL